MNKGNGHWIGLLLMLGTMMFTACATETDNQEVVGTGARYLSFSVSTQTGTRGQPISGWLTEPFGIYGYVYADEWSGSETPDYMANEKVVSKGLSQWSTTRMFASPAPDNSLRIYAYYPFSDDNEEVVALPDDVEGLPVLTVTVPTDVSKQVDFMTASSGEISTDEFVDTYMKDETAALPLTFAHRLTQIRFVTGYMQVCTVKSIKLCGVKNSGTFILGDSEWTDIAETTADYKVENEVVVTGTPGQELNEGAKRLMLLPQDPEGLTIVLTYNDGEDHEIASTLPASMWNPGKVITYALTLRRDLFIQCVSLKDWEDGGTMLGSITDDSNLNTTGEVKSWENTDDINITKTTE